jgi:prepilin-type N-terminal cleavage/methylation domain-containing protein
MARGRGFANGRFCAGFSLLEVVVAVGILSLIMIGVALALKNTGEAASAGAIGNDMARSGQKAVDQMALELRESAIRVITVAADGSSIRFQIPVDLDGNGTVLDRHGAVEYGFLDAGVPRKGAIVYQFIQNVSKGMPEVLDARFDGGGGTRRFARGCIARSTRVFGFPASGASPLTGRWIVQPDGSWGGDIDGDAVGDPIFTVEPGNGRVVVNLWAMQVDGRKNPQVVHNSAGVCLRNR